MKKLSISLLAIAALVGASQAQTLPTGSNISLNLITITQRQGGRRQGGGFMQRPSNDYFLLRRQDVQKDLKLTDDQNTKIKAAQDALFQSFRNGGQEGGQTTDRDAAMKTYNSAMDSILTASQKTRLHQIGIQLEGPMAVLRPDVAKELNLTADQNAKIKSLQKDEQKANEDLRQKEQNGDMDRQDAFAAMQKNGEALKTAINGVLTSDQQAALAKLCGPKFTATDKGFGFGGGRRQGRGGGGGGQGGGGGI